MVQTTSAINRRSEIRHDQQEIQQFYSQQQTKFILSHKGKFVAIENKIKYFDQSQLSRFNANEPLGSEVDKTTFIYLGEINQQHLFVISIKELPLASDEVALVDLRTASLLAEKNEVEQLFYAQGLLNWHHSHQYCAKCGALSQSAQSGHSRICSNPDCAKEHFPRIEPAVIFSVQTKIDGVDKLLLARQANWPDKRYSVLAGFAEHGESLELAVKREGFEEVGLKIENVQYVSSQAWPFPASLMLGFTCETNEHSIRLIDQELEQAHWFSAAEMKAAVEKGELRMPYSVSISWNLVDRWYHQQTGESIRTLKTID